MNNILNFLLVLLGFSILSCKNTPKPIAPKVTNITESVYASGFIKSKYQYEVVGKTNGVIEKIFVIEGDVVKKGDPIFQLDHKSLKLVTENARLAALDADYRTNQDKLRDAEKIIELATKNLKNDSLLFNRQKHLWANEVGTQVEYEQKELSYEKSKVDLAQAHTNYDDLKRQLKLISDQRKNDFEIASLKEEDFIVRSEVNGVVYKINREVGELINGSNPGAVIGTDEFIIELNIDEFDIVKIRKEQKVIIRMDSYQSEVFEAEILAIDPMMNTRTRSFQADAVFTEKPYKLFPNLTVEASIIIKTKVEALTIPRNYLINDTTVLLVDGTYQKVTTGLMDYDLVEIIDGIDKDAQLELPK